MDKLFDGIPTKQSQPIIWTLNDDQMGLYNQYTQNNNVTNNDDKNVEFDSINSTLP